MRKRSLAMMVVAALALPAQAMAEFCFEDSLGGAFNVEVGGQQGSKVFIHGFRQVGNGCHENLNGIQPFTGEVIVINSDLAVAGISVMAAEPSNDCYSFRMNMALDLTSGEFSGEYQDDNGNTGDVTMSLIGSCPEPTEDPNAK